MTLPVTENGNRKFLRRYLQPIYKSFPNIILLDISAEPRWTGGTRSPHAYMLAHRANTKYIL